ncbi:hypothetical protein SAMN05216460_1011 [Streptococcus sp. 45]|uniref:Tetratricopeptide repeat protein n=1 Tax=Streptococcus equinus TaxID=1335 RepID=A0A1H0MA43_STREI|nr:MULTISPECIES: hypothetical protein [Streptococcus]SDO77329.1 hypothetical protein SAMN05216347_102260 [Streptococcus equinus]SEI61283.1 hypothetical protein SAMN05216460_1011 [Streptococcus sp. 45]
MFNNISKKISKMSTENIQNYQFRIKLLMFLLTIIYIIGTFFLLSKDMMFVFGLLTIAMVTFIVFYLLIAAAITKGVYMILTDVLSPERYLKSLDKISSYKQGGIGSNNYNLRILYESNKAFGLIANGKFFEALDCLENIDASRFNKYQKKRYYPNYLLLKFMALLLSGQSYHLPDFTSSFEKLGVDINDTTIGNRQLNMIEAMDSIITNKEVNYYFEAADAKSRYSSLENNYFKAKNQLLLGNYKDAKENFQKIANENPELFYVREAKKYLEELDNE